MDKFLLSKVGGRENRAVELSLLHSFKRMRRFQPFSAIVEALRTSELVELTNDDTCVRRKVPLPETVTESADSTVVKTFEDKSMHRSIYAKGFGEEEPSTQFDIEAFFAPYGPTNAVRLRRTNEKIFKGSVFVEFDSEESQKKFLALEPKPKWKGTTDLLIKSKKDYCEEKVKEIEAGRLKPNRGRGGFRGRGRGDNRRGGDHKRGFNKGRGGHWGRGRGNRNQESRNQEGGRREALKDARYVLTPCQPIATTVARISEVDINSRCSSGVPIVQSPKDQSTEAIKSANGQKRAREEETSANGNGATSSNVENGDRPAKKVDTKEA